MSFIFGLQMEFVRDLEKHIARMEAEDLLNKISGRKVHNQKTIEKCKDRLWELERSICSL